MTKASEKLSISKRARERESRMGGDAAHARWTGMDLQTAFKVGATEFHVNRLELEEMESKNMQQQRQQQ